MDCCMLSSVVKASLQAGNLFHLGTVEVIIVGQHPAQPCRVILVQDQPHPRLLAAPVGQPELLAQLCQAFIQAGQIVFTLGLQLTQLF